MTNETRFNLNLNTNASTRAIILGNLIENMSYCIKVAAYTRVGLGPYTRLECVEMTAAGLAAATIARNSNNNLNKPVIVTSSSSSSSSITSKSWFVTLVALATISLIVLIVVVARFVRRQHARNKNPNGSVDHMMRRKSSTSSSSKKSSGFVLASENFTLLNKSANALIQSKFGEAPCSAASSSSSSSTSNGLPNGNNQYKLVNDSIWLDTLNSYGNRSQHEFSNSTAAAIAGIFEYSI